MFATTCAVGENGEESGLCRECRASHGRQGCMLPACARVRPLCVYQCVNRRQFVLKTKDLAMISMLHY